MNKNSKTAAQHGTCFLLLIALVQLLCQDAAASIPRGSYGGLQGLGGLEAVIGNDGTTRGIVSDWFGNIVGHVALPGGAMGSYVYDSRNRLTSAGGLTYAYNAEGNRVGIGGAETTSLVVDANSTLPRVLQRTKNGVTTRYVCGTGPIRSEQRGRRHLPPLRPNREHCDAALSVRPNANTAARVETAVGSGARGIANPVPERLARIIPGEGSFPTMGPPGRADVFVTAADDIAGMNAARISQRFAPGRRAASPGGVYPPTAALQPRAQPLRAALGHPQRHRGFCQRTLRLH